MSGQHGAPIVRPGADVRARRALPASAHRRRCRRARSSSPPSPTTPNGRPGEPRAHRRDQPEHHGVDDGAHRRVGPCRRRGRDFRHRGQPGHGPRLDREPLRRGAERARPAGGDRPGPGGRAGGRRIRDRLLRRPRPRRRARARRRAGGGDRGGGHARRELPGPRVLGGHDAGPDGRTGLGPRRALRDDPVLPQRARLRDPRAGPRGPGVRRVRARSSRSRGARSPTTARRRSCWAARAWRTSPHA